MIRVGITGTTVPTHQVDFLYLEFLKQQNLSLSLSLSLSADAQISITIDNQTLMAYEVT